MASADCRKQANIQNSTVVLYMSGEHSRNEMNIIPVNAMRHLERRVVVGTELKREGGRERGGRCEDRRKKGLRSEPQVISVLKSEEKSGIWTTKRKPFSRGKCFLERRSGYDAD